MVFIIFSILETIIFIITTSLSCVILENKTYTINYNSIISLLFVVVLEIKFLILPRYKFYKKCYDRFTNLLIIKKAYVKVNSISDDKKKIEFELNLNGKKILNEVSTSDFIKKSSCKDINDIRCIHAYSYKFEEGIKVDVIDFIFDIMNEFK